MKLKKFYISIDNELYHRLLYIAKQNHIAISDLIKLIANINVKTVQLKDFSNKNVRIGYYAPMPLLKLNKATVNYKIIRFIEIYEMNFN